MRRRASAASSSVFTRFGEPRNTGFRLRAIEDPFDDARAPAASSPPARGSDVTISKLLDEQGVETVPHGFRSGSGNGRPKPPTAPGGRRRRPRGPDQGQGADRLREIGPARTPTPSGGPPNSRFGGGSAPQVSVATPARNRSPGFIGEFFGVLPSAPTVASLRRGSVAARRGIRRPRRRPMVEETPMSRQKPTRTERSERPAAGPGTASRSSR